LTCSEGTVGGGGWYRDESRCSLSEAMSGLLCEGTAHQQTSRTLRLGRCGEVEAGGAAGEGFTRGERSSGGVNRVRLL
jgi:hypothetical protein